MHYRFSKTFEYYVDCYVEADTLEEALKIANSNDAEWIEDDDKPYCTSRNYYEARDETECEEDLDYELVGELTYEQLP